MDTPEDIARDEWYSDLVEEISEQAINGFARDRLKSYYLDNSRLASNMIAIFEEAKKLRDESPTATLVLFTTSIEIGLKVVLLKPVVYGLVHNESVSDLISDLAVKHNGLDRIKNLLSRIIVEYGGIDFESFKIDGHDKTIWDDINTIQNARNNVVHRAVMVNSEMAELSNKVAAVVINVIITSVLNGLGLDVEKGQVIEKLI
ncbi:hypothetical protein D9M72_365620 [compost metagenome]